MLRTPVSLFMANLENNQGSANTEVNSIPRITKFKGVCDLRSKYLKRIATSK